MSVEIEQWLAEQAISNVSDKNMDFCFAKSHELKVAAFLPLNYVLPDFNWKLCLLFVSSKYFELFFSKYFQLFYFLQVFQPVLFQEVFQVVLIPDMFIAVLFQEVFQAAEEEGLLTPLYQLPRLTVED